MEIYVESIEKRVPLPPKKAIKKLISEVAEREEMRGGVGVVFVDDSYMRKLNEEFRSKDLTTDVLAFRLSDEFQEELLGEIYISVDRAEAQAREYGESLEREVMRLVLHGILHLAGYSHHEMKVYESAYLNGAG